MLTHIHVTRNWRLPKSRAGSQYSGSLACTDRILRKRMGWVDGWVEIEMPGALPSCVGAPDSLSLVKLSSFVT